MGITARRRSDADRRIKVRHKFFHAPTIAQPRMTRLRSFEEFRSFIDSPANRQAEMTAFEAGLLGAETFTVPGYCAVCNRQTEFAVDYSWCAVHDGRRVPNWRERLECPGCHLNNRMRAAAGRLLSVSKPRDPIYLTEFISPLFQRVALKRRRAVGSEYLRDGTARGSTNAAGVRHEDVTRLTFPDAAFSAIGTFDVLEHVPDFRLALAEFFRCLRPAGAIVITAPFDLRSARTLTRATVDEAGTITHLLPPEFHWDPVDPGGALCFHHFGWDFIDALTDRVRRRGPFSILGPASWPSGRSPVRDYGREDRRPDEGPYPFRRTAARSSSLPDGGRRPSLRDPRYSAAARNELERLSRRTGRRRIGGLQ
jgi:SAM-dependent methyltransferase